jgi:ArsR family transcriptional regulator
MEISALANLFKSLSEPVRLRIMSLLLKQGELCVCELVNTLKISQSVVSRHLAYLRNNQLVIATRKGAWMYYKINNNTAIDTSTLFLFLSECSKNTNEIMADQINTSSKHSNEVQCGNG